MKVRASPLAAAAVLVAVVPTLSSAFAPSTSKTTISPSRAVATGSSVQRRTSAVASSPRASYPYTFRTSSRPTSLSAQSNNDFASTYDDECDVLVLGSGPAALALATLLSSPTSDSTTPPDVIVADANYDRPWPPNYGAWVDEWESVRALYASFDRPLGDECVDRTWGKTDCFFGGSFDIPVTNRMSVDRPYLRVDRFTLRKALTPDEDGAGNGDMYRVLKANHVSRATAVNTYAPAGTLLHDEGGSTVTLQTKGDDSTTMKVRAKLVVDCTGHETKLVLRDDRDKSSPAPGYQIAYGVLAKVDETRDNIPYDTSKYVGPYDKEAMTLFDYRTDHFPEGSTAGTKAENSPTFMYAMPLEGNRIFFEETSLVARPAVSFQECKERCATRLEHLGIKVTEIEEEEFCYIPMGGALPAKDQRIVGFGGAAAMVHPSTGYHLCRAMMASGDVARAIRKDLAAAEFDPDKTASRAYNAIWSPANIGQRNFAVFGGEFLMAQNVRGLRGFFDGFFKLPIEVWGGFLAGWPGLPNNDKHETWQARILFGLTFVSKLPAEVALAMLTSIAGYSIKNGVPLPQSVTPLFGDPEGYLYDESGGAEGIVRGPQRGDMAAKAEARRMIEESKVEELVPVSFTQDGGVSKEAEKQLL